MARKPEYYRRPYLEITAGPALPASTTTIVDRPFYDQYIEPVFNVKMERDMESLRLSSDERAFLDALGELIGARERFSASNERPSSTVARR